MKNCKLPFVRRKEYEAARNEARELEGIVAEIRAKLRDANELRLVEMKRADDFQRRCEGYEDAASWDGLVFAELSIGGYRLVKRPTG